MNTERTQAELGSKDLLDLAKWIVNHPPKYGGDHACRDCFPNSEIIKDGFVCGYHKAVQIIAKSNAGLDGRREREVGHGK